MLNCKRTDTQQQKVATHFVDRFSMSEYPTNSILLPDIKLAKPFSGQSRSVSTIKEFLMKLELQFGMHHITNDYNKICIFASNLEESALSWFSSYYTNHDITTMAYSKVVEDFNKWFGGNIDLYDVSHQISSITQTGRLDDYMSQFTQYIRLLPPGTMSESILIALFIRGLKPEIRESVGFGTPKPLSEAREKSSLHTIQPLSESRENRNLHTIQPLSEARKNSSLHTIQPLSDDRAIVEFPIVKPYREVDENVDLRALKPLSSARETATLRTSNPRPRTRETSGSRGFKSTSKGRKSQATRRVCYELNLCFKCGQTGHLYKDCPQRSDSS